MKLSQAKDYLPFVQAAAEGKVIQQKNIHRWCDMNAIEEVSWCDKPENYRIKPTPALRPWKPEEVPVGCLLCDESLDYSLPTHMVLIARRGEWCSFIDHDSGKIIDATPKTMLEKYKHSLDKGKTWLPCGVEE